MNLLDIAIDYQSSFFPHIPWRTGRLATTGMSTDFYNPQGDNSLGFDFCRNKGLQYGIILNEYPTINYNLNGRREVIQIDTMAILTTFFDSYASMLATRLGGTLI